MRYYGGSAPLTGLVRDFVCGFAEAMDEELIVKALREKRAEIPDVSLNAGSIQAPITTRSLLN